jgi:hypothetical protein
MLRTGQLPARPPGDASLRSMPGSHPHTGGALPRTLASPRMLPDAENEDVGDHRANKRCRPRCGVNLSGVAGLGIREPG